MDACGSCATKGDVRQRHVWQSGGALRGGDIAKRCDATTSWHEQRGGVEDGRVRQLRDER